MLFVRISSAATLMLLLPCLGAHAQRAFKGEVVDDSSAAPLWKVTVRNTVSGAVTLTDETGSFLVSCRPGDTLTLSMIGYTTQRIVIHPELFNIGLPRFRMAKAVMQLSQQLVRGRNYLADSLRRREEYGSIFDHRAPRFGELFFHFPDTIEEHPRDPFRVLQLKMDVNKLSQLLAFRRNARKRKFRQRLLNLEAGRFAEHYYDPALVTSVTGLHADSLQQFMEQYRPPAGLLYSGTKYELMRFIKNSYSLYRDSLKRVNGGQ
jgi:hypothetical protein